MKKYKMKARLDIVYMETFILYLRFLSLVSSQSIDQQFYVLDDHCITEKGDYGMCRRIQDCPPILDEALQGKRSASSKRCGFDRHTEIVCCPLSVNEKIGIRPAESVCQQYENEIFNSLEFGLLNFFVRNGIEAAPGEFPYMAALGYRSDDDSNGSKLDYSCGGSLISSQFVLTAAHCVNNINERVPVLVRFGSIQLDERGDNVQERRISNIIPHPEYKRNQIYNDVALLRLSAPVKWTPTVKPICLQTKPVDAIEINSNVSFIVAGWGLTDIDEDPSIKLMKTPGLELVPLDICEQSFTNFRSASRGLDDSVICAKDANTTRRADSCEGDSGGPFIMRILAEDSLVGITSFGQICGGPSAGVYTSVYTYLDWIESNVWGESDNDWKKN